MKVLWLCNMVPGRVLGEHGKGLWMDHVLDGMLRLGLTVHVLGRGQKAASGTPEAGLSYTAFEEPVHYLYYPELEKQFVAELKGYGFSFVALDLQGYRTGSMNEPIVAQNPFCAVK